MAGRDYEARAILSRIRSGDPNTIEHEIDELKGSIEAKPAAWSELLTPVVRAALIVGVGMAILQRITGISTVTYYAPTIVQFTGVSSSSSAILASIGVGVVNVGMTIVALRLLDSRGSKAAGIGTMANWTFNFIVSLTFLVLIDALGRSGAFWLYGRIGVLTLWFCWKLVPETKDKTLEEIHSIFEQRAGVRGPSR